MVMWASPMLTMDAFAVDTNAVGRYVVQLNAFAVKSNASAFMESFREKGYPVFLEHDEGDRLYKVRVGPFANWGDASQTSRNIKITENLSPIVVLSFDESFGDSQNSKLPEEENSAEAQQVKAVKLNPPSVQSSAGRDRVEQADAVYRVVARFMEWKSAWQEKNISTYLNFYSQGFDSSPKSQEAWKRARQKALSKPGKLVVDVGEVQIEPKGKQIEMSFIQKFTSSGFSDVGLKTLTWHLENGKWCILNERWLPI